MKTTLEKLIRILNDVKSDGTFVSSGQKDAILPGLHIEGLGEISMPIRPEQARELIGAGRQAPFGKGSQTVVDTRVRSVFEIDASKISFKNRKWEAFLNQIIEAVKNELYIEQHKLQANLYKLLIYQTGDFFLPHRDSEKEKDMFATLVVCLPSEHEGGELFVRFGGEEEPLDFSDPASNYKIPYAAFYADCEHEVKPVKSGYRVCLTYNLLQKGNAQELSATKLNAGSQTVVNVLKELKTQQLVYPQAILLGHQYTPENFSVGNLKQDDRPRAELLLKTAEEAGFYAQLALVTRYQMGELEGDNYNYYDRYRSSSDQGTMGEIYEEELSIEHWVDNDLPSFGKTDITNNQIVADFAKQDDGPIEQEEEGYTGNAGMTMEYWYHYGAVVLIPQEQVLKLILNRPNHVMLEWLNYYNKNWNRIENVNQNCELLIGQVCANLTDNEYQQKADYSPIAKSLILLNNLDLFLKIAPVLSRNFTSIKQEAWLELFRHYSFDNFVYFLKEVAQADNVFALLQALELIEELSKDNQYDAAVEEWLLHVPQFLAATKLPHSSPLYSYELDSSAYPNASKNVVLKLLKLSKILDETPEWAAACIEILNEQSSRPMLHKVLCQALLEYTGEKTKLAVLLFGYCHAELEKMTANEPQMPKNWTKPVPNLKSGQHKKIFEMLRPFLESPTETVFEYRKAMAFRELMEQAVKDKQVDVHMQTIRKGSPHTLRLTKTHAAYEREHKCWEEDVELLNRLSAL